MTAAKKQLSAIIAAAVSEPEANERGSSLLLGEHIFQCKHALSLIIHIREKNRHWPN